MADTVSTLQIKVLSQDVEATNRRLEELERKSGHAETAVGKLGSSSKISFGVIAAGIGSVVSLGAATAAVTREWLGYDKAMKEVQSITASSSAEFRSMRSDVIELASSLGVDATVAAKGLYQALSAGIPKDNAIEFMKVASKAAIAGVTEVNVAVDGLTNVINAYKLPVSEAERVTDMLFATVVDGKTTFEELSSNMSKATVIAASMNVPLEQVLASIISITKQGTPTSEAFTQIKAALQALLDPSDQMIVAYQSMGVESGRQAVAQYGLAGALQMVRDRYEGNDGALVKAMRSVEAYNGALSITGANLATYATGLDNVKNSAGKANKAFADNSNTLENAITSLKGTFLGFVESMEQSFGIIQTTSNLLKNLANDINVVRNMGNESINSAVSAGGAVGVQLLQDELAKLEALKAQLDVRKERGNLMTGIGRDNGGFGDGDFWTSGARLLSSAMEETEAKIQKAKEALSRFDEETVTSANLQRALADAVKDGNETAIANIRAKIDGQEKANAAAAEQADILKEVGELEILLREQKVKMADAQLAKDKESAKLRDKAAKDEAKALQDLKEDAERLATTDRERLELKIKQLETLKAQGPEEAALADKAIKAVREQIAAYDKLQAVKADRTGRSGSRSSSSVFSSIPILGDVLSTEESMIKDSYRRRGDQMLEDTRQTAESQFSIMLDAQERQAQMMREQMIGSHQFTLNAYSDFFGNLSELSKFHSEKAFKIAQAASIAQATIKMFESAVAAYAQGSAISPFLGPVFAAAALAAGAANIASIKSQQFQAYEHGGMIPAGATGLVGEAGPEFVRGPAVVTSARATDGLRSGGKAQDVRVIINNAPGYEARVTETEDDKGKQMEITIVRTIDRLTKEAESGGGKFVPALARKYNLNRNGSAR